MKPPSTGGSVERWPSPVEGDGLENRYGSLAHREFKSLPLRQNSAWRPKWPTFVAPSAELRVGHVFLLGDSIFDNATYVRSQPSVVEHLQRALPPGWRATLLAVDGASAIDVREQLHGLHDSATHLFVSAGGNDALNASGVFSRRVQTVAEAVGLLANAQARFRKDYRDLLRALLAVGKPLTVCTIYDAIPGLGQAERAGLALFNDVILQSAVEVLAPVIDLRFVCDEAKDYSDVSPSEPSGQGGAKIAQVIAHVVAQHYFSIRRSGTTIFTGEAGSA